MASVTASELQKNFGIYHDTALREPVRVTKHGRTTVVMLDIRTYERLKKAARRAIAARDLSEAQMEAIKAAKIPAKHRYSVKDIG